MRQKSRAALWISTWSLGFITLAFGQGGPPPQAIKDALAKFEPYMGYYACEAIFNGAWKGDMIVKSSIEGWYVEWTFLLKGPKGEHRENRMMITYDPQEKRYRVWRFETGMPPKNAEGEVIFQGAKLLLNWRLRRYPRVEGIYRNIYTLVGEDVIEVTSEFSSRSGPTERVGITVARRKKKGGNS